MNSSMYPDTLQDLVNHFTVGRDAMVALSLFGGNEEKP